MKRLVQLLAKHEKKMRGKCQVEIAVRKCKGWQMQAQESTLNKTSWIVIQESLQCGHAHFSELLDRYNCFPDELILLLPSLANHLLISS